MAAETHNGAMCEFSRVRAVATGWIVDFLFLGLCRRFKEGKFEEFNQITETLEAVTECPAEELHEEKTMICAFLSRVMHGRQLDVHFEENEDVLPLMSAAKVWSDIKHTVAEQRLFMDILELLFVQSVAVCLISEQISHACLALKWFERNYTLPQNLCSKVSSMVTKKDPHDPLLNSYSFPRLLETVKTYLDAYLERNPSDYLVKEATKMLRASPESKKSEEDLTHDDVTEDNLTQEENIQTTKNERTKGKLLATNFTEDWEVDSCQKPFLSPKRIPENDVSQLSRQKWMETSTILKKRKYPQKWTHKLDRHLKRGVKRHGVGKWAQILLDSDLDFEGRSGVMLKDRWRILVKSHGD